VGLDGLGECAEYLGVVAGEGSRFGVHHAQGADALTIGRLDRVAGVETNLGVALDDGVVAVPRIKAGIFYEEVRCPSDRDVTEGFVAEKDYRVYAEDGFCRKGRRVFPGELLP